MHRTIPLITILSFLGAALLSGCNFSSEAAAASQPQATPTPVTSAPPSATPVLHQDVPGELPLERSNQAGDHDASRTADQRRAPGGDRFTFGRFERPFNAETMDRYLPHLDIQAALVYQDETWIYAVIGLKDYDAAGGLSGRYAAEFDVDQDGRGDWIVIAEDPQGTEWSTARVGVWVDRNDDVGGASVLVSDQDAFSDGYESALLEDGRGDDPDLAWARQDPEQEHTVQLAVKRELLEGDDDYMVGTWAGGALLVPADFDLHDRFTHEQAGAAQAEFEYFYPVRALHELDNACRMAIGFTPTGDEPGLCPVEPEGNQACAPDQFVCYNFGRQQVCVCVGD